MPHKIPRRARWTRRKWKARKIALSPRGIYEPVAREEDVLRAIVALLTYSGIPVFRERERVPACRRCGAFVACPSDAGHPDLHGRIPARKLSVGGGPPHLRAVPFYIECKRPDGAVATWQQKQFIRDARRDGALAFFASSWADVWWNFWGIGIKLPEAA